MWPTCLVTPLPGPRLFWGPRALIAMVEGGAGLNVLVVVDRLARCSERRVSFIGILEGSLKVKGPAISWREPSSMWPLRIH